MALIYHELNIPLDTDSTFDYVAIKQGDSGSHKVRATLINNNSVYTIPTSNVTHYFKFRKPDNTFVLVQATVSNNQIIADVTEEMLRVAGTGRGEFMIVQGSTELKTATFYFKIVPQTYTTDDVISSSDFATFASLLAGAGNAASNANAAAAAANAAAANAEAKADLIPDDYTALVQQVEDIQDELENLDVETDETLTEQGKPADAKATGDAIAELNGSLAKKTTMPKNVRQALYTLLANSAYNSDSPLTTELSLIEKWANSKDDTNNIVGHYFKFKDVTWTPGYINDNGTITESSGTAFDDELIPAIYGDIFIACTSSEIVSNGLRIAQYNGDEEFLGRKYGGALTVDNQETEYVKYGTSNNLHLNDYTCVAMREVSTNFLTVENATLNNDGDIEQNSERDCTAYLSLEEYDNDIFAIRSIGSLKAVVVCFYDSEKTLLQRVAQSSGSTTVGAVPNNASFIRICCDKSGGYTSFIFPR